MEIVKERGIAVEVCPLSNQMLGYVPDLRNHPAVLYINAGLPVVLSTDDPAIMRHSLSHDFYVAFMAWGLDLRSLKQLAMNSLIYSAMSDEEKRAALAAWETRWQSFVAWVNQGSGIRDQGTGIRDQGLGIRNRSQRCCIRSLSTAVAATRFVRRRSQSVRLSSAVGWRRRCAHNAARSRQPPTTIWRPSGRRRRSRSSCSIRRSRRAGSSRAIASGTPTRPGRGGDSRWSIRSSGPRRRCSITRRWRPRSPRSRASRTTRSTCRSRPCDSSGTTRRSSSTSRCRPTPASRPRRRAAPPSRARGSSSPTTTTRRGAAHRLARRRARRLRATRRCASSTTWRRRGSGWSARTTTSRGRRAGSRSRPTVAPSSSPGATTSS